MVQVPKFRYVPWRSQLQSDQLAAQPFVTNYISTTKYTLLLFLPLNFWEQFQKAANFYFLVIAVLSSLSFSPKTPLVSIVPLFFVLVVTAVKEGYEDYRRYLSDVEINNKKVACFRYGASAPNLTVVSMPVRCCRVLRASRR